MIDQIDERLSAWVEGVLGGIKPQLTPPKDADGTLAVNLYLLELVDDPLRRNTTRPPLQPALRYLVTTYADEPKDAHRLLGMLVYAAFAHTEFEVELKPLPHNSWSAFKIAPRPAFILRVPLPHEWPTLTVPLVREGATTQGVAMVSFFGRLLGPNRIPLANARIQVPDLQRYAHTDAHGNFILSGIPAAPRLKTLQIMARQRTMTVRLAATGSEAQPVEILFDLFSALHGQLVQADDGSPIADARVELPALFRTTTSDRNGRFTLDGVPPNGAYLLEIHITVGSNTRTISETVTDLGSEDQPSIIRIDL